MSLIGNRFIDKICISAINKSFKKGKKISDITKMDIWNNSSMRIYKYYKDETEFCKAIPDDYTDSIEEIKCERCGKIFYGLKNTDTIFCDHCAHPLRNPNKDVQDKWVDSKKFMSDPNDPRYSLFVEKSTQSLSFNQISDDEWKLLSLNLSYVKKNSTEYINYNKLSDDTERRFYPDFVIQDGYGSDKDGKWELIEFKADNFLISNGSDLGRYKYKQCRDRVGFVTSKMVDTFIWCISSKYNRQWPNPRLLAYSLMEINSDLMSYSELVRFNIITNKYAMVEGVAV